MTRLFREELVEAPLQREGALVELPPRELRGLAGVALLEGALVSVTWR